MSKEKEVKMVIVMRKVNFSIYLYRKKYDSILRSK